MGNVYRYTECGNCHKLTDADLDCSFTVHGSRGLTELAKLEKMGRSEMPVGKIAAHFCGYCGGFILWEDTKCACGHFDYQGWNYGEDDSRHWEQPEEWSEFGKGS